VVAGNGARVREPAPKALLPRRWLPLRERGGAPYPMLPGKLSKKGSLKIVQTRLSPREGVLSLPKTKEKWIRGGTC